MEASPTILEKEMEMKKVYLVTVTDQSDFDRVLDRVIYSERDRANKFTETWLRVNREAKRISEEFERAIVFDIEEFDLY